MSLLRIIMQQNKKLPKMWSCHFPIHLHHAAWMPVIFFHVTPTIVCTLYSLKSVPCPTVTDVFCTLMEG